MNESDISDDEINVPAGRKTRRIMISSSESSDSNFDYGTELSDTENEDGEGVDEVGPSNSIVSEEWLPQNAERPPFPFIAYPGKTFDTPPKKVPLFYLEKFLDEELIKLITEQTNLYAAQFFDNDPELKPRSRIRKWKDTKDVLMLSSIHNDEKTMIEKRRRTQEKLNVVLDYNKNMGGVDLGHGVMVAYTAARNRLKKFYKKIFLQLLDMCCFNAYIIYKKDKGHLDRLHFLIECVEKLVDNNIVKTHPKTSTSSSTPNHHA